jgi:serine/threonine protein kinase
MVHAKEAPITEYATEYLMDDDDMSYDSSLPPQRHATQTFDDDVEHSPFGIDTDVVVAPARYLLSPNVPQAAPPPPPPPPPPALPVLTSTRYVLGKPIGRGGFGTVFLGMDVVTSEHVAVKEIPVGSDDMLASSRSEFDLLTRLQHPNVVKVRGFDVQNDKAYIFMEWMPGGSVHGMITSFKFRLHESLIQRYVKQALEGLHYLHSQSIIHRDIKPANMLVTLDGTLKLSDFGTCKTLSERSASTFKVVGTPSYMAPEAIRGKHSLASDVWSLGASVIEMASGKPPWSEKELHDPIAMLFHIGMVTGPDHHPDIPNHLSEEGKDFLKKCFVVDPAERWTTGQLLEHPFIHSSSAIITQENGEAVDAYMKHRQCSNFTAINSLSQQLSVMSLIQETSSDLPSVHLSSQKKGGGVYNNKPQAPLLMSPTKPSHFIHPSILQMQRQLFGTGLTRPPVGR